MTLFEGILLQDVSGIIGLVFYLGSYGALQAGLLNGQGYGYAALNGTAAAFVLFSMTTAFNLAAAATQVFYLVVSVAGIVRHYVLTHRTRFSPEEQAFLDAALPTLPRLKARRLLDLGLWIDGDPGTVLAKEEEPVPHLIWLDSGAAEVTSDGRVIARCEAGSLIGEATAPSGEKATATVRLTEPSRYLAIDARLLRNLLARDGETRTHLEACFAGHLLYKLRASNAALARHAAAG
jgi:hypothetical protein